MRTRMLLLAAAVLLAVPACGDDDNGAPATTPSSSAATTTIAPTTAATTAVPTTPAPTTAAPTTAAPTTATTTPPTTAAPTTDVRVYFVRNDLLAIAHRGMPACTPLRGALEALLAGPTAQEQGELGTTTAIPDGTSLLGVDIDGTTATIDLSGAYDDGGGTRSMTARLAEVVFTATQFDNVETVVLHLDGAPVSVFSSEGLVLDHPLARLDFRDMTSGVLVDTPLPTATVGRPVVIRGESDSYEANFMVDVWSGGTLLSSQGFQAGGAWGDWQDFEISVGVSPGPSSVTIDLYDEGGCGTDPECPPITHNPLPLQLTA